MSDFKAKMHQSQFRLGLRFVPVCRWILRGVGLPLREKMGRVVKRKGERGQEGLEGGKKEG